MKNITKLIEFSDHIQIQNGEEFGTSLEFTLFTFDSVNNIVYIVTNTNNFIAYSPSLKKISLNIELNKQDILSESANVIAIQYIPDLDAICMASDKGDILMYTISNNQLECVGIVGAGILCMSWSPDYELFILATESDTLIQMTKDWDIVSEVPINTQLTISTNILRPNNTNTTTTTTPTQQPQSTLTKEEKKPVISWRGDGQFFVCSSFDESTGKIQLRVWERSLVLHSISEATSNGNGLENQISWRPSGSLIATSQRIENRHDIAFFERNGLKHGEFTLRSKNSKVKSIQWSSDSEILAIELEQLDGENKSVLQLWHRSNYYWFLKNEFHYDGQTISNFQWDLSSPVLRVLTKEGRYTEYKFCWDYNVSQGTSIENPSIVVMVDGSALKMTPFRRLVVPPPMSAYTIQLPSICSLFAFNSSTYQLAVLTVDNSLYIYTPAQLPPMPVAPNKSPVLPNYSIAPTLTTSLVNIPKDTIKVNHLRHLVWLSQGKLVAVESSVSQPDTIVEISYSIQEGNKVSIDSIHKTQTPNKVLRLTHHLDSTDRLLFETIDGYVYFYHSTSATSSSPTFLPFTLAHEESGFKFQTPCPWFASTSICQEDSVVGLNDRSKLYINQNLVCSECNSFAIHNKFLLFTTISHVLRSVSLSVPPPTTPLITPPNNNLHNNGVHLGQNLDKLPKSNTPTTYDDSIRDVERGSRIVAVVPHDTRLVLQMPRGNLETISPRSLTLSTIRELLNEYKYGTAFSLMRRNRIDMNFIYDHNPIDFIKHIEEFVDQVSNIDYLNLFISSLREEDTSKTLFIDLETQQQQQPAGKQNAVTVGKVNLVCDKLREVFIKKDSIKYNLPILTTYVKKSPPELDQVLRLVQSLRGEEINDQGETITNRLAEESLDYIVFLVDVNRLYDIALGTYDFELVIMVAQKSQKDPKEYMSFLSDLQKMEKFYQRYSIDKHLGRWELALENLSKAGEEYFEDCLKIMKDHKLYKEALTLYKDDRQKLNQVQEIYGDYLQQSNYFEAAAYLFSNCGQLKKALSAYKDAGLWKLSLLQAKKLGYSVEETKNLSVELADAMRRSSKYLDAATLYAEHCSDYDAAIHSLGEGLLWTDLYYLVNENEQAKALLDSVALPLLEESTTTQLNEIKESYEKYEKLSNRIVIVRQTKANHVPLLLGKLGSQLDPETSSMMSGMSGMFSEGGSVSSSMTTSSYRSTYSSQTGTFSQATKTRVKKPKDKSKMKPQKVRLSSKEGGKYEEEYLVEEMKKMIPTITQQESMCRNIKGLVLFGRIEKAKQLQHEYRKYLDLVDKSLDALSESATAVLPENIKEKERERELLIQQQNNTDHVDPSASKPPSITISKVSISREKYNWNLNLF
eukprot:gene4274-5347_t